MTDFGGLHATQCFSVQASHDLESPLSSRERRNQKGTLVHNSNFMFLLFNEDHVLIGNVFLAQKPTTAPP